MSDPIDARFLREMVRELSSDEPKPIDWERVEAKLFARLEDEGAPGSGLVEGAGLGAAEDDDDDLALSGFGERISEVGLGLMDPELMLDASVSESSLASKRRTAKSDASELGIRASELGDRTSELGDRISSPYVVARVVADVPGENDGRATIHVPSFDLERAREERRSAQGGKARRAGDELGKDARGRGWPRARRYAAVGGLVAAAACFAFFLGGLVSGGGWSGGGKTAARPGETAEITAERWVDPADVPMAPGLSGAHDLGALRAGDMVEATSGAVSFGRADKVSWTLAPGSRVFIRGGVDDPRHVLVLESGSIRAEVIGASAVAAGSSGAVVGSNASNAVGPASGVVDPLVVEAGETRVAVQNSLFSVTRSSKGIVVDVERGLAIVGPREELGLGSGRLLHESESGVFSLDGGRIFKSLVPVRTALAPLKPLRTFGDSDGDPSGASAPDVGAADALSGRPFAGRTPTARDASRGGAPTAAGGSAAEQSVGGASVGGASVGGPSVGVVGPGEVVAAEPPVLSEGAIHASLDRCFVQVESQRKAKGGADDGVALTMRSTLRLRVADDGAIKGASFSPPLRPDLQSCAVSLLSGRVAPGAKTLEIPVEIRH